MTTTLSAFARAYIECALWSSTDGDDTPLDDNYSIDDLAPETLAKMQADCEQFEKENAELLTYENCLRGGYSTEDNAGHDFWLTRNGHGAGFWDGDWKEPAATQLTDSAHAYGECNLYVGDDGLIYC